MFKKLTALVLVLGMVLSLFAGCQTGLLSSGKIRSPSGVVFDMNTDFNPYAFTIVLTDEAAKNIDEYDKKDFPEVQYAYVVKNGENLLWVIPEFGGKERIFGAMKLMLQRSDVLGVEPYIDETFEDATSETFVTPQGAIRADGDYYPYGFGVTLTDEAAKNIDEYSAADFPELDLLWAKKTWERGLRIQLKVPSQKNVFEAMKIVSQRSDVYCVDPDWRMYIDNTANNESTSEFAKLLYEQQIEDLGNILSSGVLDEVPTDAFYPRQWSGSKIQLAQAWEEVTRTDEILVGVIDTGIDSTHPDFNGKINWQLSREFSTADGEMMEGSIECIEDVKDLHYHGTMVAGIIAAKCHNTIGIAGVSKTVKLVSLRAADADRQSHPDAVAAAIEYATTANIPILNISLGFTDFTNIPVRLANAINNYNGLIICSAGNDNVNTDTDPQFPSCSNSANIISVGSSTSTDARASSSNYGATTVDLFAPGDGILSCYPLERCPVGQNGDSTCEGGEAHYSTGYHFISGTSFAAPHVAGVAALIWTQYPNLTAAQVKARILNYVDIPDDTDNPFAGICVTGGRLNAYKAVHSHHYAYDGEGHTQLQHNLNCTVCDHPTTTNHSYTVASRTATGHVATCYTCGRTESGSHVYANNGAYCMICQYINPNGGIEIMGGQGENPTE